MSMKDFIANLPKAELHVHLEGTLEPEMLLFFAKRNGISISHSSIEDIKEIYQKFENLQQFLHWYELGASVLCCEQDFYDLTLAYLLQANDHNVARVELSFDPQTHLKRGMSLKQIIKGINRAMHYCRDEYGMSISLVMNFLRHESVENALETLEQSLEFREQIVAIGLDGNENSHAPRKFQKLFEKAKEHGFRLVSHAGEEGPPEYIWQSLDVLKVERIDHGIACLKDEALVKRLVADKVPLTLCPLSNVQLNIFSSLQQYPLRKMMDAGLLVTINSDDPAYFGGYLNENLEALAKALNLTRQDLCLLATNSFEASFASREEKDRWIRMVKEYGDTYQERTNGDVLS